MNETATELIDSHAHLDDPAFDDDREGMLQRAAQAGITDIVLPAVTAARWPRVREICGVHDASVRMHATYGLHPMFMSEHHDRHLEQLGDWLRREPAVAVGECGLDFHVRNAAPERQREFFRTQLALARELDLPIIIHSRKAVEDVILILRKDGAPRGVMHSYSGSMEQARQLWQLGMHISLGGPVTHEGSHRLHRLAAAIPLDQLLLETDAPDQPGAAHQGQRNEPAYIIEVLDCIAARRDESRQDIAAATSENARRLFGLSKS